ncbi:COG1361 family protein [Roseiconus lacunae]|uniref:DUF11 domain-containing protein n=1 Tax=Roseiconus lacunae TaxID=2605694 RepID=UPI001E28B700|nr:DUF11 domain-containing protein [Roseiconus lacunae]MCD0458556.1 DUF11 domain-containing protein [Roseiconus lacunae]
MLRGRFKTFAIYSLIGIIAGGPAWSATPGGASRLLHRQTGSNGEPVQTAHGVQTANQASKIRQVVGKQPTAPAVDSGRSLSFLPRLFGGSDNQSSSQAAQRHQPNRQSSNRQSSGAPQARGILNDLFGTAGSSSTSAPQTTVQANRSPNEPAPPVDWQGIPYHQAKSQPRSSAPKPIRDPQPGEARLSTTQRVATSRLTPLSNAAQLNAPTLPKAPSLDTAQRVDSDAGRPPTSSRRTASVPSQVASSKTNSVSPSSLSPLSSSRRSGRRDLPTLDASEIAAAKAAKIEEDDLVPKISRRRIKPDTTETAKSTSSKSPSGAQARLTDRPDEQIASSDSPPQPAKKKATIQPSTDAKVADGATVGSVPSIPRKEVPSAAKPAAKKTPSAEIAVTAPKAIQPPAKTPQQVTNEPAETQTANVAPQVVRPEPSITQSQVDQTPTQVATVPQAAPSTATTTTTPAMPAPAMTAPATPSFGGQGQVASGRIGPSADAFQLPENPTASTPQDVARAPFDPSQYGPYQPRGAALKPADAPLRPETASVNPAPIGSGIAMPSAAPIAVTPPTSALGAPQPSQIPPVAAHRGHASAPQHRIAANPTPATAPTTPFAASTERRAPAAQVESEVSPDEISVASELPGIRVITQGPRHLVIRQTEVFEIRVENRGSIDAEGVMVRTLLPAWAEIKGQSASRGQINPPNGDTQKRMVWALDRLPAGSRETLFVRLQALQSGTHELDVDWTLVPQKSIAKVEVREPKLDLVIEGPEDVIYGESQTYKVRVLNPGDGIAPNVVFTLSPNSPTPQTQRIGNIPSGKEAQFEVELTAQDLGDLKIHGFATGELGLKTEAEKTIKVLAAELEAVLSGPELKYQNTDAVYQLQLTNNGTTASNNVQASLGLPPGTRYVSGLDEARRRGSKLTWEIDTLAPGETREYEFTCNMVAQGVHNFDFLATGSAAGRTSVELETQVESIADLVLSINDPPAPAPVGSEVTYEIVIKNRGSRQANDVRAVAQFSKGIEPRRIEGHSGQVMTGQVLLDPIKTIRPGEEVRIQIAAEAETDGHHRFRTEIRSGETVLVAEEATHYMSRKSERVSRRSTHMR